MTSTLRGHVLNGRIVVDERVDLPEGTAVELALVDGEDDLEQDDLARLDAALAQARQEIDGSEGIPAEEVIARIRGRTR